MSQVFGSILERIAKKRADALRSAMSGSQHRERMAADAAREKRLSEQKDEFLKPIHEQRAKDAEDYSLKGLASFASGIEQERRAKSQEKRAVAKEVRTQTAFDRTQRVSDNAENLSRIKRAQLAGIPLDDVELTGSPSLQEKLRLAAQAKQLTSQQVLENKMKAARLALDYDTRNRAKRPVARQAEVDKSTKESWAGDPKTMVTIDGSSSKKSKRGKPPGPKYDPLWDYHTPKGKRLNTGYLKGVLTSEGAYAKLEGLHGNVINAQDKIYGLKRALKKAKSKEEKKELLAQISKANADLAVARNAKRTYLGGYIRGAGDKAYSKGELTPQALEQRHRENATALKGMELSSPPESDIITATQAMRIISKEAKIKARNSDEWKAITKKKTKLKEAQSKALKKFPPDTVRAATLGNEIIELDAELRKLVKKEKENLRYRFRRKGGSFVK
tara:strand:+ start:480 stop:1817 length:1338 start_codon:yes stop_codon:yes gene_type:complete